MHLLRRSFFWAILACFISLGTALTSLYTLSARVGAPEVTRMDECLLGGKDWDCVDVHKSTTAHDPGAISWQEIPLHYYLNKYKFESKPRWSFELGSGYPIFLDGIYRNTSLIRQWLVFFPSDQGRDVAIFFRFVIWTWGIVFAVSLFGVQGWYLFFVGLASTMLPYIINYLDIIFLDVEMMVPWIFALLAYLLKNDFDKKVLVGFLVIGFWVATQSFIQAQIVFALVLFLMSAISFLYLGQKGIYAFLAFVGIFALFALPNMLEFKKFFQEVISNRHFVGCVANHGLHWSEIVHNSMIGITKRAEMNTFLTIGGVLPVLIVVFREKGIRLFFLGYLLLFAGIVLGAPTFFCRIPGVSAIHFWRHLVPYLQVLFLILASVSVWKISTWSRYRKTILTLGFLIAIIPLLNRTMISVEHLRGKFPKENSTHYSKIPQKNVYSKIQALSIAEDRRHFSPDFRMYPNYSSAFSILDLRVLYGSFPKRIFQLNDQLFNQWHETPFYKHADRFVGFDKGILTIPESFEKLMLLHRVSLVSFSKNQDWFGDAKFYNRNNCRLLQEDELAIAYFCPQIGGVGFFPHKVVQVKSEQEAIEVLKSLQLNEAFDFAVIEGESEKSVPAQGKILNFYRGKDKVIYTLDVTEEGYFVFTDSYFPGWKATINGAQTAIYPANVAFKSVRVPRGNVTLKWSFEKAE